MSDVVLETVPATCLIEDVCRLLKISPSQFFEKRAYLQEIGVLVPQATRIDRRPRFQGAPIARFLGTDGQAHQARRALRAVSGGKR